MTLFSDSVSHVIAEDLSKQQAMDYLQKVRKANMKSLDLARLEFVKVGWFTACMKEKKLVHLTEAHQLKVEVKKTQLLHFMVWALLQRCETELPDPIY